MQAIIIMHHYITIMNQCWSIGLVTTTSTSNHCNTTNTTTKTKTAESRYSIHHYQDNKRKVHYRWIAAVINS